MSKLSVSLQSPCKGCAPRCGHWPVVTGLPAAAWSPWWLQCEEFREMVRGVETRGWEQPGSSCGDWAGWEMLGNATKCISAKTDIRPRTESCLHDNYWDCIMHLCKPATGWRENTSVQINLRKSDIYKFFSLKNIPSLLGNLKSLKIKRSKQTSACY